MKAGPTGRFPMGKISEDDHGELVIGVKHDPATGLVIVNFGALVSWIGLPPEGAIAFAEALIRHAKLEEEKLN